MAEISRYRLFHGEIGERCYLQISQGKGSTNPRKVIITCFGLERDKVISAIDVFLDKTGIEERDVSHEELTTFLETAKMLLRAGVLPEWLR